jgi:hypothetical protein
MTASTSAFDATLQASEPAAAPGAADAPADAVVTGEEVVEGDDTAPLDVAAAEALADAELALVDRADAVAELVPRAAGEPLARPVSVEPGVHAIAAMMRNGARIVSLMTQSRRKARAHDAPACAVHRVFVW